METSLIPANALALAKTSAKTVSGVSVRLAKTGFAKFMDYRQRRAERKKAERIERTRAKLEQIDRFSEIYHPSVSDKIKAFVEKNAGDLGAIEAYTDGSRYVDFIESLRSYYEFTQTDAASRANTYVFSAYSMRLLETFEEGQVDHLLASIAKKYKVAAQGNAMLTGVLVAQRRHGMAALAAADGLASSFQAGAQNADARTTFTTGMKIIQFHLPAAEINETHQHYVRTATRFHRLGVGDQKIAGRALFSLVFNNGHCRVELPDVPQQFAPYLLQEFRHAFGSSIWSPKEAAAHIDQLISSNAKCRAVSEEADLKQYMRKNYTFPRFMPEA